ncbi:hypothetical protein GWK47_037750 [Chionoecetes opilio]|uniref:Uncharacterized protein n=1 Tax=Chionoecetes opilio TaxID=41210 RepID=A0A8J4YD79_CHIOP|nr:hypothetical protein GWK47_037750 [Chionoecetes opilio]
MRAPRGMPLPAITGLLAMKTKGGVAASWSCDKSLGGMTSFLPLGLSVVPTPAKERMAAASIRVAMGLVFAAAALIAAAPTDVSLLSPFFMPAITNLGCGDDVEDDECAQRDEVCSGMFPDPDPDFDPDSNSTDSLSIEFQECLTANQPPQPLTQASLVPFLSTPIPVNIPFIPMPVPDMVPFRFCALNVTGLLNPDLTVNHTAVGDLLNAFVPPGVSADVVVSAVSICPNPLLHSLTAFMHCLRAACLVLTTSDMIPSSTPPLVLSPYFGAP